MTKRSAACSADSRAVLTAAAAGGGPGVRGPPGALAGAPSNAYDDWLHANRNEDCSEVAMIAACLSRRLDILDWLVENTTSRCPPYTASWVMPRMGRPALISRARIGNRASVVEILQGLHDHELGGEYEEAYVVSCAAYGCLGLVGYLHETSTAGNTPEAMDAAAEYGHFEVVEFLREHRSEGSRHGRWARPQSTITWTSCGFCMRTGPRDARPRRWTLRVICGCQSDGRRGPQKPLENGQVPARELVGRMLAEGVDLRRVCAQSGIAVVALRKVPTQVHAGNHPDSDRESAAVSAY
ncbi:hypothetical protein FI667_g15644, partial [Globisporangium splendens]